MPEVDPSGIESKTINLPREGKLRGRKTVIFDMDETLVHCCGDPYKGEVVLEMVTPEGVEV
jgi:hypothetical protein